MKEKTIGKTKTYARHEIERNLDLIKESIDTGLFLTDIYRSLNTELIGSYVNFLRLIRSGRYPTLTEALEKREELNKARKTGLS